MTIEALTSSIVEAVFTSSWPTWDRRLSYIVFSHPGGAWNNGGTISIS